MSVRRTWSWATSDTEVAARRAEADLLIGDVVQSVRYITIDYRRDELRPELGLSGPREITEESELERPTWRYGGFDAMDYGLELGMTSGAVSSITWDPPGDREGIGPQQVPLLGTGMDESGDVAIWGVTRLSPAWLPVLGKPLTRIDLHYVPWDLDAGSQWCRRITIGANRSAVEIIMADAQDGRLVTSADNVAVLNSRPSSRGPLWCPSSQLSLSPTRYSCAKHAPYFSCTLRSARWPHTRQGTSAMTTSKATSAA